MLRRFLRAVTVVVFLVPTLETTRVLAAEHPRGIVGHWLGGYGPGPFGRGDFSYAGSTSHTVSRHRELVPSFTTRFPRRPGL